MMRGGSAAISAGSDSAPAGGSKVTALASHGAQRRVSDTLEGAVALKQEASHDLSPTEKLEALQWSKAAARGTSPRRQQGRTPRRSESQGLRRRDVRRVRQLHAGAERHVHEVRYVWAARRGVRDLNELSGAIRRDRPVFHEGR